MADVKINGWVASGQKDSIRIRNVEGDDGQALRAALMTAREGGGTDRTLLWELPRRPEPIRMAARISLGLACTVGVMLLLAAFVAGAGTRNTLLVALVFVVFFGGGVPLVVVRGDRGVKVFADGTLERADWGGVSTFDLRRYERVTLNRSPASDAVA
ncbi:MAG: hypothetical protein CL433_08420 [Acidimicrobiaceae bacterium]|nr:hypothetical protein [Acidimicrobiaceae bacterium]HAB58301.1 hypothetical protein [Acidimicrobiaceae bacterium]